MKPNGTIQVTQTFSTEDRWQSDTTTVWDHAAATKDQAPLACETSEIVSYNEALKVGRYTTENAEADLEAVDLSDHSDFVLKIKAPSLRVALELRNQILLFAMLPNGRISEEREAVPQLRAS